MLFTGYRLLTTGYLLMHKTVVLNVVGLTPSLLGENTPALNAWMQRSGARALPVDAVTPAVTCTGFSSGSLTGCSGGAGTFAAGTWVSVSGQQFATVAITLKTRSARQPYRQFSLSDTVDLRNSLPL